MAWYWHRLVPLLRGAGCDAIPIDLPGDDERAGLSAYAERVIDACRDKKDVILVAGSLGGFTAPLVCKRVAVRRLVFVNAMIPLPGETAGDWWDNTGSTAARIDAAKRGGYSTEFDDAVYFLHDLPPALISASAEHVREQAGTPFSEPCRFEAWPEVPVHVIAARDDRFFPIDFQRRLAQERLHLDLDEVPGGHLVALSHPQTLATQLLSYVGGPRTQVESAQTG